MSRSTFSRIWLPGFLLQSVIIGGGYATGRELVEFFLGNGPLGGLLGMLVATALFSVVTALSFEFARLTRSFNYRSFFGHLLGRGWFLYEVAYLVLALLILAVVAAASGEIMASQWGLPRSAGVVLLMLPIAVLVFRGTALIEKALAGWSFLLYATYALLVGAYLWAFGDMLAPNFASTPPAEGWFVDGVRYAGYNLAVIPLILFCVPHFTSRRDAVTAGLLAGPLVMIPAALFFLAMAASWPAILEVPVPADYMMQRLHSGWLQWLFYVVIFGTFVETGTAIIHALNERIALRFSTQERTMPPWLRPAIAVVAVLVAVVLAVQFGIIGLIAKGYGTLTWIFILVYVLPLATFGLWTIRRLSAGSAERPAD